MNKIIDKKKEMEPQKIESLKKLISILTSYLKLFRVESQHIKLYTCLSKLDEIKKQCDETKCNQVLQIISAKLYIHAPTFTILKPKGTNCIDVAINRVLKFDYAEWSYLSQYNEVELKLDLDKVVSALSPMGWDQVDLTTQSGVRFTAYYKGEPVNDTIVFVAPCGMPVEAFSLALEKLHEKYFVMTWENPFLFHSKIPGREWSMTDDIQCIKEMMRYFKRSNIHLIGVCGGVPIAIVAAAELKEQVVTLSSCHGDIYMGIDSPMTSYKKQFLSFLQSSLQNETIAREIYELLLDPALLFGVSDTLAPYIIYQYLSLELYMRYASINSVLMTFDLSDYLDELNCHFLIISSEDDRIAHPGVSKLLSEKVKYSVLWMRPHAEHHNVIAGDAEVYEKIMSSIEYYKSLDLKNR